MQIFLLYLFLFITGCMIGWVLEFVFRRLFTVKKWVNPGFMKGPWLPLYGFGMLLMFTLSYLCVSLFPETINFYNPLGGLFERNYTSGPTWADLIPISLMWIGMNLLEFLAGLIFIKGFRVKLWDYTNIKGNFMGIVCPLFSVIWLAVAVIFYYGIDPFMYLVSTKMHTYMFGGNGAVAHFGFIFVLGVLYGFMIYDFIVSIDAFKAITNFAKEKGLVDRYESLKEKWSQSVESAKHKIKIELPKPEHEGPGIKEKLAEMIYIDPEKEKLKGQNYDENGRPAKIDEEK